VGYSDDASMVRVDFFNPNGKWKYTEAVKWIGWDTPLIHEAFAESLRQHFASCPNRLSDLTAVCLEPYHKYSHPIVLKNGSWVHKNNKEEL
jgi:hypothetical protein